MDIFDGIYESIVQRKRDEVVSLAKQVLEEGIDPEEAVEKGFKRGMEKIGDMFADLEIFIPDIIRAADIMNEGLEVLSHAPSEVVYGTGNEKVVVPHRNIEDTRDPVVFFSAVGTPHSEEDFVKVCQSYAAEPLADTFSGPLITSYRGMPIASGSPVEVEAGIWNVVKLREAARFAGRPNIGIHNFISVAELTDATIAGGAP